MRCLASWDLTGFPHWLKKRRMAPNPKYQTPYIGTIVIAILSVVVTVAFESQIGALSSVVNFGALSSFLFLHLSVINYFMRKKQSKDYVKHLILPIIGFIIIGYVWINLDPLSKQLGFIWLGIGIVYLIVLKLMKRDTGLKLD
ncbi:amino acid permease [Neobacillus niacini]|uniref:amino acid permease n=1 Tax=Neobacillus niacini TaxID=86668 RepID=UPI0021CB2113|nr:amino acid permease [Neobacillus niacini]MCM3766325.1 amino acid permease [Neobacillus niacini]